MDNPVHIRRAVAGDLDDIVTVENAGFDQDGFSRKQLSYLISKAHGVCYVAESEGCIIGYLSLLQRSGSAQLRIYSIVVHPDARGRHIGQKLIDKSREYAAENGLRTISLEVRTDNEMAIKLYRKNGFVVRRTIKNYYGYGSDALYMIAETKNIGNIPEF